LERRGSTKRSMRQATSRSMRMGAEGIKISCSGRIGGAEIARTEWHLEGRLPLHTLRADIDYGFAEANTTYGKIGVKAWIFRGEVLPTKNKVVFNQKPVTEVLTSERAEESSSEGVREDVTTN
jgi:small subunit ribosomal protein S3